MEIAVGTRNPAKINAVKDSVSSFYSDAKIIPIEVASGISEMPRSEEESLEGAFNRARNALEKTGADIGMGLEGHTTETRYGMLLVGLCVAIDKDGNIGIGHNGGILLPENVAERVRKGEVLGPVMDSISGEKNMNKKGGAIGYFTEGRITRREIFGHGVVYALSSLKRSV